MILSGRNLAIGYKDRVVGRDLDIALSTGEVLALLGPNGGGKTTLLDRKSTRLNSSHYSPSRMPSSA